MDNKKYSEFIKNLEIMDIRLNEVNTKCLKYIEEIDSSLEVELTYECKDIEVKTINEINMYPKFNVKLKSEDGDEVCLVLNLKFNIKYSVKNLDSFSREYVQHFTDKNVPINIWPYAREIISSITSRMGYPSLIISPYKG
ncbi:preprotein translocase subunit SecB [Clostridium moniliforme]|uniref:Preprotein translocase subunit SecB n=1 Tax=Clostridium moniliforme TaxID=39489 RepID=A0ABS4EYI6_9CLOT|nr:protein-export chaperone SecB [Clostridium moniliforme]MBP1888917.1 preprotein translocase subunit SecB [Clostridium moniliforme]